MRVRALLFALVLALVLALVPGVVRAQFTPHACHSCKACEWQCGIQCGGPQNIAHWQCSAAPTLHAECSCTLPGGAVAAIVFAVLGVALLAVVLAWCYQRRRTAHMTRADEVLAPNVAHSSGAHSYSAVSRGAE